MSAFSDAFLFFGLFDAETAPIPYDVRIDVDCGNGELGTLTSPSPSDVRRGVLYGGDGAQYRGLLIAPPAPTSNQYINAWNALYQAQISTLGQYILATVEGYGTDIKAVISDVTLSEIFMEGPHGESGGWNLQVLLNQLSGDPPKGTRVSCNGEPEGHALEVLEFKRNNGVGYLSVVDTSALTK
jgi:hypothetical protein